MRNGPGPADVPRSAVETDMVQAGIMGALITQRGDTVKQMWTSEWRIASNQNSVLILRSPSVARASRRLAAGESAAMVRDAALRAAPCIDANHYSAGVPSGTARPG